MGVHRQREAEDEGTWQEGRPPWTAGEDDGGQPLRVSRPLLQESGLPVVLTDRRGMGLERGNRPRRDERDER